jgi:putative SOS response-associated peptidase YedK
MAHFTYPRARAFLHSIPDTTRNLRREDENLWLDSGVQDVEAVMSVLQPYPEGRMHAYEVTRLAGNVKNHMPELIQPVKAQ